MEGVSTVPRHVYIGGTMSKLINDKMREAILNGTLTVDDTKELETRVEFQEGLQFDKGMAHPMFMTDPNRNTCTLENVPVLITDRSLKDITEMSLLLNKTIFPKTKQLVIIAPEISGNVLPVLLENKLNGNFMCLPINAPYVGQNMREFLQDLCAITGAKFISEEADMKLDDVIFEDLGKIPQIVSTTHATIITGSNTKTKAVADRIALTKRQMGEEDLSEFDKEKLKERLGKLTQGIAVLKLGGSTKVEMEERKERAIDAIAATQAAIRSGIVPGGETIYLKLRKYLDAQPTDDINQGYADTILSEALKAPFYMLLSNSGFEPGEWIPYVRDNMGLDVTTGKAVDMIKEGIIDPVEVSKSILQNSLSVANKIITVGCAVITIPEDTPKK